MSGSLDDVSALFPAEGAVGWSCTVVDEAGRVLLRHHGATVRSTASVGKLLLLLAVARLLEAGRLRAEEVLDASAVAPVADSGLLQHLRARRLPVADLAVLVAAVSDNLATNVLLDRVGLDVVAEHARDAGLERTRLLDLVRDERTAAHPPRLSEGTTDELAGLLARLAHDEGTDPAAARVLGWLSTGVDLSMVGAGLGLDPLAHTAPEPVTCLRLRQKTGTDADVRADVGLLQAGDRWLAYAVVAEGPGVGGPDRDDLLDRLRRLGLALRAQLLGR